jgi:hypothetical protein
MANELEKEFGDILPDPGCFCCGLLHLIHGFIFVSEKSLNLITRHRRRRVDLENSSNSEILRSCVELLRVIVVALAKGCKGSDTQDQISYRPRPCIQKKGCMGGLTVRVISQSGLKQTHQYSPRDSRRPGNSKCATKSEKILGTLLV